MKDREPIKMETKPEIEGVEILPANIGELPTSEAAPLLSRAASRIEIARPRTEFWEGIAENLRGAGAFLEAQKSKIAPKTFRAVAGATLITTMVSACGPALSTPEPTPRAQTVEMTPTSVSGVPGTEETQTPEEASEFLPGDRVGFDIPLNTFVVVDPEGNLRGLLGDGSFDNGVQVTILYHLRGGKVQDVPIGWVARSPSGERLESSGLKIDYYTEEPPQ